MRLVILKLALLERILQEVQQTLRIHRRSNETRVYKRRRISWIILATVYDHLMSIEANFKIIGIPEFVRLFGQRRTLVDRH